MHSLKGAIFSLRDVLVKNQLEKEALIGAVQLIRYLHSKNVQPVLVSNSNWVMTKSQQNFADFLSEKVGFDLPYYLGGRDIPYKQKPEAMAKVLDDFGWKPQEVVYIGSTQEDMIAAKNGRLLFLNAQWYAKNSPYGFEFSSAAEIAKFIECCCLMPRDWFWGIDQNGLRCFSIAPLAEYSRRYPEAAEYSTDAKNATKFNKGDLRFWGLLMAARLHFSGLAAEADYVAPYPGHKTDSPQMLLTNALRIVSGSLRAQYLSDLVIRHTTAQKSQSLRRSGQLATPENQLNTIRLRPDPIRTGPKQLRYKAPPLRPGKTVLVVDDICTQGNSFEAARSFIHATGANVICVSWLKTPANDYSAITKLDPAIKSPYSVYSPQKIGTTKHWMSNDIMNSSAPSEIQAAFQRYSNWDWPVELQIKM